jgi:hypothetical protein
MEFAKKPAAFDPIDPFELQSIIQRYSDHTIMQDELI